MTVFFTIATTNYLPLAVSLLDSVAQYHPEFKPYLCLTDYLSTSDMDKYSLSRRYPLLQLHELQVEEFDFITKNYDAAELSNASKVLFAQHLFKNPEVDQIVFCDSDILFFDRLPDTALQQHDIVFTPHFTSPPDLDRKYQELEVLNAGMFNGGFFKLNRSAETEKFLSWFRSRCVLECISDRCRGIYYDQLWINFVPLYFPSSYIERNQGMNMAYWNLHERTITETAAGFMVNHTTRLSFFHFSGWDYNNPMKASRWSQWDDENRPDLRPLLLKYQQVLKANQYEAYIGIPNYYISHNKADKKSLFKKFQTLFRRSPRS